MYTNSEGKPGHIVSLRGLCTPEGAQKSAALVRSSWDSLPAASAPENFPLRKRVLS